MYIRISKGHYPMALHIEVTARLEMAAHTLIPAIRQLPGCMSYYAGSDETTCTMVNVSVWDTLEHAQAMSSLAEMAALAQIPRHPHPNAAHDAGDKEVFTHCSIP